MDILVLIQEVKKRPLLWNNTVPGYNEQKSAKVKLWDDICGILDKDFKEKSYVERQYLRRQIQRRWKSLRDCFFRELGKMKRLKSCDALTLYKPYRYFKNLGFLLDVIEKKSSPFASNNLHHIHYAIKTENVYKLSYDESLNEETSSEKQEEKHVNEKHDGIAKEANSNVHDCKPPVLLNCLPNLKVKFQGDQNINTGKNFIKVSKDIENNAKQSGLNIYPNDSNTDKGSNLKIGLIPSSKVKVLPIKIVKSVLKTTSGITNTNQATGIKILSAADVKVISPLNQSFKPSQKLSSDDTHQNICNIVKATPAEQNINLDEMSNNIEKNPSLVEKLNPTEIEGDKKINYVKENALSDNKIILQNKKFNIGQIVRKRLRANRKIQSSKKINKKQKSKLNKDEDRMFFLSLIKEFKKIPEEFRFDVKLEIMQILKRGQTICNNNCSSENSVCSYQSSLTGAKLL